MPRSSGTYTLPVGNPVVSGTVISTTWANGTMNDIGNEITNSLPRDGSAPPTANIPMGNYKITGIGAATLATDVPQYQQVQAGSQNYLTSVAGTNTITANLTSPTLIAYATGNTFRFIAAGTNTGAATLNVNGIGAKAVTKNGTSALSASDIVSGRVYEVFYDGTQFQLITQRSFGGKGADVASATALPLINDGNYFDVTGTTTITSFASLGVGEWIRLHFDDALILTHNATDLVLPTGANITTAAGDEAEFIEYASGDWRCVSYTRASGAPLTLGFASASTFNTGTNESESLNSKVVRENVIVLSTAQATTSGTTKDFTDIPAWAKKITVLFNEVSFNSTSPLLVQIGDAGGIETTGYSSVASYSAGSSANSSSTAGFLQTSVAASAAANTYSGSVTISKVSGNTWVASGTVAASTVCCANAGVMTLSDVLTQVRVTSVSANTFDGGSVNVSWE